MLTRRVIVVLAAITLWLGTGASAIAQEWPNFRWKAAPEEPNSMVQIARSIDTIEEKIRDDGIVVLQHPDVWGQARMTRYRVDFERNMLDNLKFEETLSAVISRADRAALESQSAIDVSLGPGAKAGGGVNVTNNSSDDAGKGQAALVSAAQDMINKAKDKDGLNEFEKTETFRLLKDASVMFKAKDSPVIGLEPTTLLEEKKTFLDRLNQYRRQNFGDDNADAAGYNLYQFGMPVSIQPGEKTHRDHGAQVTVTVRHDFGPEFLASSFRNFVVNDLVDRLAPFVYEAIRDSRFREDYKRSYSKEAREEQTKKRREYQSKIVELERELEKARTEVVEARGRITGAQKPFEFTVRPEDGAVAEQWVKNHSGEEALRGFKRADAQQQFSIVVQPPPPLPADAKDIRSDAFGDYVRNLRKYSHLPISDESNEQRLGPWRDLGDKSNAFDQMRQREDDLEKQVRLLKTEFASILDDDRALERGEFSTITASRVQDEEYPIAPSDLSDVFLKENLLVLALFCFEARQTENVRASDVRAFLSHELSAAYDLVSGSCREFPPILADSDFLRQVNAEVQTRNYQTLKGLYDKRIAWHFLPDTRLRSAKRDELQKRLNDIRDQPNGDGSQVLPNAIAGVATPKTKNENELNDELARLRVERPVGPLCWAIVVDAALLNCRLRQELREFNGVNGSSLTCDPENLFFHLPMPKVPGGDVRYDAAQEVFEQYVRARWPIICFSLDPINDQQNIADAFSRTRDLQVALALAFSSGRLGFNQLLRYRRQLDYEAATIALNRTVSAFVFGNETFGWRFAPRYQTPPQEATNFHVIANQLLRGGPGRNYQIKNSKLEAGERELSAVVIMPSILQRVRMDVTGNWWRLTDPDETTLHTAHMLEQGRKVIELRQALASACDSGRYRQDDLSRLAIKIDQLESMLRMQTKTVAVPYGNTLGGFDIFKKGSSALAPVVVGHQGVDELTSDGCRNAFLIFGKNFSIQETSVVAGGQRVDKDDVGILSREVMRVRLPKNLEITTTTDGQKYVELHLATPNGVSNRMLLPFSEKPVTTTTITDVVQEVSGNHTPLNWTRSTETKMVTGPRPKCYLDKDAEAKAAAMTGVPAQVPGHAEQHPRDGGAGGHGDGARDGQANPGRGGNKPPKNAAPKAAPPKNHEDDEKAGGAEGRAPANKAKPKGAGSPRSMAAPHEDNTEPRF